MEYALWISIDDLRYCLLEPFTGPWGDDYFYQTFDKMTLEGMVPIIWKYGIVNGSDVVKFKVFGTQKVYAAELVEANDKSDRKWLDFYTRVMRPQALQEILPHL